MTGPTVSPTEQKKALALIIGVGRVDPNRYGGDWDGKDATCVKDAKDVASLAEKQGFHVIGDAPLLNQAADRKSVIDAITDARSRLAHNGIFMVYFAGHGTRLPRPGDPRAAREAWCLFDGLYLDVEWSRLLTTFKKDARVLVISDSCFSGGFGPPEEVDAVSRFGPITLEFVKKHGLIPGATNARSVSFKNVQKIYDEQSRKFEAFRATRPEESPAARVILIAACQANQQAWSGPENGVFTARFLNLVDKEGFAGSYRELFRELKLKFSPLQSPFWHQVGTDTFPHESVFTI